jgi:hypothetical protein
MTTPILFLTDETGKRTGVVIEINHYNALLKKLEQPHTQPENRLADETSASAEVADKVTRNERDRI